MEVAVTALFLIILALVLWWFIYSNRPGNVTFQTTMPPSEVLDGAVMVFSSDGWTATTRTRTQVTFMRESRPSCCLAVVLAFLLIIPAIIYMILWRATNTASVTVSGRGDMTVVGVAWNKGWTGRSVANAFEDAVADLESRDEDYRSAPLR